MKTNRHHKISRLISCFILISTLYFQTNTYTLVAYAADPFSPKSELQGFFTGLPDKLKNFFYSSSQSINGFFQNLRKMTGGATYNLSPQATTPEYPIIPISADLIQVDATMRGNCIADSPPDEYLPTGVNGGTCLIGPSPAQKPKVVPPLSPKEIEKMIEDAKNGANANPTPETPSTLGEAIKDAIIPPASAAIPVQTCTVETYSYADYTPGTCEFNCGQDNCGDSDGHFPQCNGGTCPSPYQCPNQEVAPYTHYDEPCAESIEGEVFDTCWGLYPTTAYLPDERNLCTIDLLPKEVPAIPELGLAARTIPDTRIYEVPARTVVEYPEVECNRIKSQARDKRECAPEYSYLKGSYDVGTTGSQQFNDLPTCYPKDLANQKGGFVRKLNNCNEAIEPPGIEPPKAPSIAGDNCKSKMCNVTDGPLCVQGSNKGHICRKAVQVRTCEALYTTYDAPAGDAWSANCAVEVLPASSVSCGNSADCTGGSGSPEECDGTADASGCCYYDPISPSVCSIAANTCGTNTNCCGCGTGYEGCYNVSTADNPYPPSKDTSYCDPDLTANICSDKGLSGCASIGGCCKYKEHWDWPLTPDVPDCGIYQWTRRSNMYRVLYYSNAIEIKLRVRNLSNHIIKDKVTMKVTLPDFLDYYADENSDHDWIESKVELNGVDIKTTMTSLHDNWTDTSSGIAPGPGAPHGGDITWEFWNDTEQAGMPIEGDYIIVLWVVPADTDQLNFSYYGDHMIGYNGTVNSALYHYINNLDSDNRLANLNYEITWSQSKVEELQSFWIGSDLYSTAAPSCAYDPKFQGGDRRACTVDANARPFGYPVTGTISQDWGGIFDINTQEDVTWSNGLAEDWGPRYGPGTEYFMCGAYAGNWYSGGIDFVPIEGQASETEVYSTHAGFVVNATCDENGRGCNVVIQSNADDDCWPEFVTEYHHLKTDTLRVFKGEYVPRHKLLGMMGATGAGPGGTDYTGYTHLTYQIRYPQSRRVDLHDNNCPMGQDYNPPETYFPIEYDQCPPGGTGLNGDLVDPPANLYDFLPQKEQDAPIPFPGGPESDNPAFCGYNPYICETNNPNLFNAECTCVTADCQDRGADYPPYFFPCQDRRAGQNTNRCYYDNAEGKKEFPSPPTTCPIRDPDPLCTGYWTSTFGPQNDGRAWHASWDWAGGGGTAGTEILAVSLSRVAGVGCYTPSAAGIGPEWGFHIVLEDLVTGYAYVYGHMGAVNVSEGDIVESGDVIGTLASSPGCPGENTTGPHLHFEVRTAIDCMSYTGCTVTAESVELCGPANGAQPTIPACPCPYCIGS